ncbi:Aste57867_1686 [Aphanomyces stellatus]|uniref:Aste57867_1686 protein n=1 Tax=Aphanomyces stellatus TaxID=120398 RepID=A0A485K5P6_9STRA|nr:hypothetical protein As57867_001684 [Aphanomyces stellatus]VFT78897.1 Aste57867_1686 [Aphanomyces stellatus]
MVMTQRTEHVYPHAWAVVSSAFWRKYPNPALPHVEKMDVLSRFLDDRGRLHTARLCRCVPSNMPAWATTLLGNYSYVYEETICDPEARTLHLKSTNLSFRSVAVVDEVCDYTSVDDRHTKYTQTSRVVAHVPILAKALEEHWIERGAETAQQGLRAMEAICDAVAPPPSSCA